MKNKKIISSALASTVVVATVPLNTLAVEEEISDVVDVENSDTENEEETTQPDENSPEVGDSQVNDSEEEPSEDDEIVDEPESEITDVITFEDDNLKEALKTLLGKADLDSEIKVSEIESLTELNLSNKGIESLSGLEHFKSLETLDITGNMVKDITCLSNMEALKFLNAKGNSITDISVLNNIDTLERAIVDEQIIVGEEFVADSSVVEINANIKGFEGVTPLISNISNNGVEVDGVISWDLLEGNYILGFNFNENYIETDIDDNVVKEISFNGRYSFDAIIPEEVLPATPPVINCPNIEITVGSIFDPRENLSATDFNGKDLTDLIKIVKYDVNPTQVGTYVIVYEVEDENGLKTVATRIVEVKDDIVKQPVITASDITIKVGDEFDAKKDVTAKDYKGNDLTEHVIVIQNDVDNTTPGQYEVTYLVLDEENNLGKKTIIVTVEAVDEENKDEENEDEENKDEENQDEENQDSQQNPPIINAVDITIKVGDTFDPVKGITAKDSEGNDLTPYIVVVSNTVDTSKVGTYEVKYAVLDSKNVRSDKSIVVKVEEKTAENNSTDTTTTEGKTEKPQTGDASLALVGLTGLSATGLVTINRKKRKN